MIYFLKGTVAEINEESIVIDVRDVGYQILVSHVDSFHVGDQVLVYTYNVVREDENYLIGFVDKEEKDVFMSLIKVKGLGPKTVINALSATTPKDVINAISSNNVAFTSGFHGLVLIIGYNPFAPTLSPNASCTSLPPTVSL